MRKLLRKLAQQSINRTPNPLHAFEVVGARPRSARVLDFLLTCDHFGNIARSLATRAPEIDLKGERISLVAIIDHPLQRRVGDETAIPVVLAFDLDGRKARRQGAACHDVLGPDRVGSRVEVHEVASPDIDGTRAEACHPGVEAIKIDEAFQRLFETFCVVEARSPMRPAGLQPGHERPREKESRRTAGHGQAGTHLIEDVARVVAAREILKRLGRPMPRCDGRHVHPKLAQTVNAVLGSVAGDDSAVDRTNRNAGNPVRMNVGFRERLVDASLIRA